MVFETFTALVGFLALAYSGVVRFIQGKLIDKREMQEIQAESKRLNDEFEKAKKADNKKKMDEIMQKQMEFLPKMNSVMFKQFKPMIVILVIFAAVMFVVNAMDPSTKDDIRLNMTDDGKGCDRLASDNIFTACFNISGANYGKWTATGQMFEGTAELGSNQTYFLYNPQEEKDTYYEPGKGEGLVLSADKPVYYSGDLVTITAVPAKMTAGSSFIIPLAPPREIKVTRMALVVSNGTYFKVDLPFTIPLVGVKSIYQPYWWFILISLVGNLAIGFVMNQVQKKDKKNEEKK